MRLWQGLCVASFYLGIGTKENMIAALPLLGLYDAAFVSGSLGAAWRARRGFWLALASGIVPLAALLAANGGNRGGSIGLGVGVSPLAYALTQPQALLTYLKLSVIPSPLIFDYGIHWARPSVGLDLQLAANIVALLGLTLIVWFRSPPWGFLGAWFFIILAPTSLAPGTTQMIVEHRMYLPADRRSRPGRDRPRRQPGAAGRPGAPGARPCLRLPRVPTQRGVSRRRDALGDTVAKRPDNDLGAQ